MIDIELFLIAYTVKIVFKMRQIIKFTSFLVAMHSALFCLANPHGSTDSTGPYNYDFHGETFLNTQKTDYCLLARINGSIVISHRPTRVSEEIFIPENASNKDSRCDYYFESILQLSFKGIIYKLHFARNDVPTLKTQAIYCENCDDGSWTLKHVKLMISNVNDVISSAPATKIHAMAEKEMLNDEAGDFKTGISLQRGYRCNDKELYAPLEIEHSEDLSNVSTNEEDWDISVRFYDLRVQPFLVIDRTIKDPVLCADYTVFIVLIILLPIFYFAIFIIVYRVKERYGCPPDMKRKDAEDEHDKKQLVKAEIGEIPPHQNAISPTVRVTPAAKTSTPAM